MHNITQILCVPPLLTKTSPFLVISVMQLCSTKGSSPEELSLALPCFTSGRRYNEAFSVMKTSEKHKSPLRVIKSGYCHVPILDYHLYSSLQISETEGPRSFDAKTGHCSGQCGPGSGVRLCPPAHQHHPTENVWRYIHIASMAAFKMPSGI